MIITKIKAGLGNQMFQYACGRALALRNGDKFKLDISDWSLGREKKRQYLLGNFNILEDIASEEDLLKMKYPFGKVVAKMLGKTRHMIGINRISFDPGIIRKKGNVYLDGYWQSEKYFNDFAEQIREDFQLKDPLSQEASRLMDKINADDAAVSINVRRGDNAHSPPSMKTFGCPGMEYYNAALETLTEKLNRQKNPVGKINLYVFSDEIDWVKQNLHSGFPVFFVSGPEVETCEEMALMSACRHNIISNSTFGWWGAWLNNNPKKIVIAPKQWALIRKQNYKDIIPEEWIRI
jgi:hypothetical protein